LILLALLLGSDYTSGVNGLGPHKAIKLLRTLDSCSADFFASRAQPDHEHHTVALFRALMQQHTVDDAVELLLSYHPGAKVNSAAMIRSPSDVAQPVTSSYSSMSVAELTAEMQRRGLKAQNKEAMISKLQQIAASSPGPTSSMLQTHSPTAASDVIYLSDSDSSESESEAPSVSQRAPARKRRAAPKVSKEHVSLRTFLRTNLGKVYNRYHSPDALKEMELVLQSYLQPELHPSVDTLEQQLHTRMSVPSATVA
jgi:5'-3' exonuclease